MLGRAAPWRSKPSQEFQQLQAQLSTPKSSLYMLQRLGPASFIIGQSSSDEEHADAKYKVTLGNAPSCSCSSLGPAANKEPCIHLLFVLVRVFRIPANNALLWQSALTDREVQQILDGTLSRYTASSSISSRSIQHQTDGISPSSSSTVQRRPVEQDEPCPICYEPLSAVCQAWLVWCHNGCGRSIHGKCMRVWSDHQTKTLHQDITCPLCRCLWGVFEWRPPPTLVATSSNKTAAGKPHHKGVNCAACQQSPIEGARYRCLSCAHYNLCTNCFSSGQHLQHSFACQQTPTAPDQMAERPGLAAIASIFRIGGLLQCSKREGPCRSATAGDGGDGTGSGPVSSSRSPVVCDSTGGSSSHRTAGIAAAPVTAILRLQPASTRGSSSANTDSRRNSSGRPPNKAYAVAGLGHGRCQQHRAVQQQQPVQQTTSRPLEQQQQQELFVGTGKPALPTVQQQQQHAIPTHHPRRLPIPKYSRPSPANAAGAAAIAREVQSLAVSGWAAAAPDPSSQLGAHPGSSCSQESSGKQERQKPLKTPARRASGIAGSTITAFGQQQQQQQPPLNFQLVGTSPTTDIETSADHTRASSGAITTSSAASLDSISASKIGSIGRRTTRRTTAEAVAAAGHEKKSLGTKAHSRNSSVSNGSSSTAVLGSEGQGSKCPSGGLLTATRSGDQLNFSMTGTAYQQSC